MPSKVRIIAGPRNTSWDGHIRDLVESEGYGKERYYFGIENQERADEVRKGMRNGGRHLGVSVKSFWEQCSGCKLGGPTCRYHVRYTAYHPDAARSYKAKQAAAVTRKR